MSSCGYAVEVLRLEPVAEKKEKKTKRGNKSTENLNCVMIIVQGGITNLLEEQTL